MTSIRHDLAYALRGARRAPGLTAAILLTFALGLGANAALFTVADRVLFRSPPGLEHPETVRRLVNQTVAMGNTPYTSALFSVPDLNRLRDAAGRDAEIEGYDPQSNVRVNEDAEPSTVAYATTGFFHVVGVKPYRGRFFATEENQFGDPRHLAVLSHAYWQRAYGGDPSALGKVLRVDTTAYTIIGVAPPQFDGLDVNAVDVWAPWNDGPRSPRVVKEWLAQGVTQAEACMTMLMSATIAAVHGIHGRAIVLAHLFSILPKVGLSEEQVPAPLLNQLATALAATGTTVEINERWRCPTVKSPKDTRPSRSSKT